MFKKTRGILGTFFFHGAILTVVVIFGFSTPLPLPDEEGIIVNFGTDEFGIGDFEPSGNEIPEEETVSLPETRPLSTPEEANLSQDFEDAPVIEESQPEDATVPEDQVTPDEEEKLVEEQEEVVVPEEEVREVDERALFRNQDANNTSESEGITEGTGNQGNPTGSPESNNHLNVLSGGEGVPWSLDGRAPEGSLPIPEYNEQVEGTVVVRIKVDRDGKVTSAEAGVKGSNTTDRRLLEAARAAALKARFNSKPGAPLVQQGTLTYIFILQ
jgi:colicin import membrane protein